MTEGEASQERPMPATGEANRASGSRSGRDHGAESAATGNPIGLIVGGASKLHAEKTGSDTIEGTAQRTAKDIAKELKVKFKEQGWI
jgi:hypothetical protein